MTYLHDKNIVHARLTSVNVYLEPNQRVKVSLIDTDERQIASSGTNQLSAALSSGTTNIQSGDHSTTPATSNAPEQGTAFNLSALTYLSPELVRSIRVTPGSGIVGMDTSLLAKEADVFAFGTLLFELFEERFPFASRYQSFDAPAPATRSENAAGPSSPSAARASSKLFHSLCLDSPVTPSPRSGYNSYFAGQQNSPTRGQCLEGNSWAATSKWNGNIRTSASELIYQIGSGQMDQRNSEREKCPALVEHIISACWRLEPGERPSFKQLRFQ